MKSKQLIAALVVLVAIAAVLLLWRRSSDSTVNLRPSAAVGEVLAEEVGRLLGGNGKVVLFTRQPPADGPDANRERIESFEAAIRRKGNLKLAAPEWLPMPPRGAMDLGVVGPDQILTALDKNPDANAFLVIAGLPPCSSALVEKLAARSIKLVAVCGYTADVRRWLESKALAVAIVPRFGDLPPGTPAPKTAKDWFDREYQLFTPETTGQLPY